MNYEKKYKEALERAMKLAIDGYLDAIAIDDIFPELKEDNDERIRKELIAIFSVGAKVNAKTGDIPDRDIVAWLEKQGKPNPYSGVSFKYNDHIWGMCARDNGIDILLDKQLFKHLEKQGEQTQFDYEHADIPQKDFVPIEPKMLNADKVIAWLVGNIIDFEDYVRTFKKDFGLC